jgi:pimeloyl-ACP methyl ester carboxylesterase
MEVREVAVDGADGPLTLSVAESGAGGRPLVLVHGFTGAKEDFTDWLDALAGLGWHAIAPDQRGHGQSPQPADEAAYSFDAYAVDLLGLLDAMGWSSAVALGHSMGGMVLQTAALRAPERFEAIVLMDTSHRALRADAALVELGIAIARGEGMAALLAAQEALAQDEDPLANDIDRRLKAERPGYKAFGDGKLLASSPSMYAAMLQAITDATAGLDRLDDLRTLTVPTLVIVGEHDQPFVKPSQRMADAIPGAELAVIPDAAHSPQFENPELWWKALRTFLDRL